MFRRVWIPVNLLPRPRKNNSEQAAAAAAITTSGLAIVAALILSTCGLPSTSFLSAPILPGISSEGPPTQRRLFFAHNTDNDIDDFDGYDIWYKLYATTETGEDLLRADETHIEATPRQPGSVRLQTRGFRRGIGLRRDDSGASQQFDDVLSIIRRNDFSTGSSTVFELDLRPPFARPSPQPSSREAEITVTRANADTVITGLRRRNTVAATVTDPVGEGGFYGFWDRERYVNGQTDVYSGLFPDGTTAGDMYIIIYVLSVGLDRSQATFSRYYSEPLRLDEAQITFSGGG